MPHANANGIQIAYEVRGSGPPLLLINGFRRSRLAWQEGFLRPLAARFRLVLMDNRGTGHSDKPQDGYSVEAFADDSAGLLQALGIPRAHVFGVSMGGMIAQRVATRHPEQVQGLGLGCTHCGGKAAIAGERRIWELLRMLPTAERDAREVARLLEEAYYMPEFRAANRPYLDCLFDLQNQNPTPTHAVQGHAKAIDAFDGSADLERIHAPTLVLTGDSDPLIPPANSRLIAQRIPGARLEILPHASHLFWIEKPQEAANAVIRFFESCGA